MGASTYTVVYKLRHTYWVVRYTGDPPRQTENSPSSTACFEAVIWGREIATWGDI